MIKTLKDRISCRSVLMMALLFWGLSFLLSGCVGQAPKLETNEDKIAAVYATIEGVANSITTHVEVGTLPPDQAREFYNRLDQLRVTTDAAAMAFTEGRPQNGAETLQLVNKALLQLQLELQAIIDQSEGQSPGASNILHHPIHPVHAFRQDTGLIFGYFDKPFINGGVWI